MIYEAQDINASVIGCREGVYSLKIQIPDLGLYINGMTLRQSKKNSEMWLQPPKHKIPTGKYVGDVEFDTSGGFWKVIYEAAMFAYNDYRNDR